MDHQRKERALTASNPLRAKLLRGQLVLGLSTAYPEPGIVEAIGQGWDLMWVDGQHGQFTNQSALNSLRASAALGLETMVRVPSHDPGTLGSWADTGPSALMVPMVNTRAEAEAIVQAVRFPPLGDRSYGGRRAADLFGRDYPTESDLVVVAQIETLEAAANAHEIIAVEGIDMLFFGPSDMKLRMGIPVTAPIEDYPELVAAMRSTAESARRVGKFSGTVTLTGKAAKVCSDLGYQLLIAGSDGHLLQSASQQVLTAMRSAVGM
jgi:4-hydroxy-2-oxoheptanedioate aldolase